MAAANQSVVSTLTYAEDCGHDFPDWTNGEILEYVSEFWTDSGKVLSTDSLLGRAVLSAYTHGSDYALDLWYS